MIQEICIAQKLNKHTREVQRVFIISGLREIIQVLVRAIIILCIEIMAGKQFYKRKDGTLWKTNWSLRTEARLSEALLRSQATIT